MSSDTHGMNTVQTKAIKDNSTIINEFINGDIAEETAGENGRFVDDLATKYAKIARKVPEVRTAQDSMETLSDHFDSMNREANALVPRHVKYIPQAAPSKPESTVQRGRVLPRHARGGPEIDDKEDPNFADTDYHLAAYAAGLRVLTSYNEIEGYNILHELFRQKQAGETSAFEQVINRAVEIASDHLVPKGLETRYWKILSAPERLYLKGLELEKNMEARSGAYQELAKGFGGDGSAKFINGVLGSVYASATKE